MPEGTDEGDDAETGLEDLYRREFGVIAHAAYVVCGSHGRSVEIAQEAFAVAFTSWPRVSQFDRPGAWVRRVAINLAIKDRNREARTESRDPHDWDSSGVAARDDAVVDREVLRDAIATLPTNQRLAIVLTYFHDLPCEEVAATIGCSQATVRVHLHRARTALGMRLSWPGASTA